MPYEVQYTVMVFGTRKRRSEKTETKEQAVAKKEALDYESFKNVKIVEVK